MGRSLECTLVDGSQRELVVRKRADADVAGDCVPDDLRRWQQLRQHQRNMQSKPRSIKEIHSNPRRPCLLVASEYEFQVRTFVF